MRKMLFVVPVLVVALMAQAGVAMAGSGTSDTGPGCGLGKEIWKDTKGTDTVGHHLLISTTNNPILPLQAAGITTGSWGCQNNRKIWSEEKLSMFAQINFDNLAQDMAQGHGEHLASLATLMGVPSEHQAEFFALTQERYTSLVKAGEASPVAMIKALNDAVATHPLLAQVSAQ